MELLFCTLFAERCVSCSLTWGENTCRGCSNTGRWGRYVAQTGNRNKEAGKNSIMRSLIICTPHQTLFRMTCTDYVGQIGGGRRCLWRNLSERDSFEKLGVGGRKIFKWILHDMGGPGSYRYSYWATGWRVRDRIPVGTRFSTRPDRPWGPPSLL